MAARLFSHGDPGSPVYDLSCRLAPVSSSTPLQVVLPDYDQQVNFTEAKRRLRDLIDAALRGETVLITQEDKKVVQLVPVTAAKPHPQFGSAKGLIEMADDFDEPVDDFAEYMQ